MDIRQFFNKTYLNNLGNRCYVNYEFNQPELYDFMKPWIGSYRDRHDTNPDKVLADKILGKAGEHAAYAMLELDGEPDWDYSIGRCGDGWDDGHGISMKTTQVFNWGWVVQGDIDPNKCDKFALMYFYAPRNINLMHMVKNGTLRGDIYIAYYGPIDGIIYGPMRINTDNNKKAIYPFLKQNDPMYEYSNQMITNPAILDMGFNF